MGIDIGGVSTKGVIIDKYNNIIVSSYIDTGYNIVSTVNELIKNMREKIDVLKYQIVGVGVTGAGRKLIGNMLEATVVKNEINSLARGVVEMYPEVRTIIEIGGEDEKIILVNEGVVSDYTINNMCMSGTGAFISSLAKRLEIGIDEVGLLALKSKKRIKVLSRCMVFTANEIIHKIHSGYAIEDILMALCRGIASNYVNNVAKGKKICGPIVFNGGVSKNVAVVKELERLLGEKIIVNKNSHLMGAIGVALMARDSGKEKVFDLEKEYNIESKMNNCNGCSNNCEMVWIYKNNKVIDYWGNKCKNVLNV